MHQCFLSRSRPVARIDFGEGVREPQKVDLLDQKSGLFEPHPLNRPTKNAFLAYFVTKSGPFGRWGGASHPRTPPPRLRAWSRSRFTPLMSKESGLSVMGDCQCSYTGVAFCENCFCHNLKTNKIKYTKVIQF